MAAFASMVSGPSVGAIHDVLPKTSKTELGRPLGCPATRFFSAGRTSVQATSASLVVGFVCALAQQGRSRRATGKRTGYRRISAHAYNHDCKLEHKGTVSQKIDALGDASTSLTKYMQAPTAEFFLVPLPAGVKLAMKQTKAASDGTMEQSFELRMPTIKIPKMFELNSIATGDARQDSTSITIEGNELKLLEGVDNVDDLNARIKFYQKTQFRWSDTPLQKEIIMDCHVKFAVDLPQKFRWILPKPMFNSVGGVVMKTVLGIVQNAFLSALATEYKKWATDEQHRTQRAQKARETSEMEKVPIF